MKTKHFLFVVMPLVVMNIQLLKGQVYDFPIRPGTQEWKNLKTYDARLYAYNIPKELLISISTKDLVQTCLNYPEFRLIITRNSMQQGYDYLKSIFNGFVELEKRNDSGIELMQEYKKLNPASILDYDTPLQRGVFAFKIKYIEILLAQKPIIANMNNESKKDLVKICIANCMTIERMPNDYTTFGLLTPALVLARIMDVNNNEGFVEKKLIDNKLRGFILNADFLDSATLNYLLSYSKDYLKNFPNE